MFSDNSSNYAKGDNDSRRSKLIIKRLVAMQCTVKKTGKDDDDSYSIYELEMKWYSAKSWK